jgi:hypothetical protein
LIPVDIAPEASAWLLNSTYVRGVIIDGDRGVLLTGRDDSALIIEG